MVTLIVALALSQGTERATGKEMVVPGRLRVAVEKVPVVIYKPRVRWYREQVRMVEVEVAKPVTVLVPQTTVKIERKWKVAPTVVCPPVIVAPAAPTDELTNPPMGCP